MPSRVRFVDNVGVSAFGNISEKDALITASADNNNITFKKGDNSEFTVTVNTGSGGGGGIVNTGSLMTTASVSNNTITFTKGDGTTFPITVDTGSGGSGGTGAELAQTLTTNQTVGGITPGNIFQSGSTIENLLRTMLITYIEPTISSLAIKDGASTISTSTRDVGASFTANTASFSAGVDSPNGDFPESASLSVTGADQKRDASG